MYSKNFKILMKSLYISNIFQLSIKCLLKNYEIVEKRSSEPVTSRGTRHSIPSEVIEFSGMRFLITDTPNELTIKPFIENLLRNNVKLLVGICGVNYKTTAFDAAEIEVKSFDFLEGTLPDERLKKHWLRILVDHQSQHPNSCVAVHCNSGLGRAALLVAMALIELGMSYDIAVAVIRSKRRGAISDAQFAYLKEYHPQSKITPQRSGSCLMQ